MDSNKERKNNKRRSLSWFSDCIRSTYGFGNKGEQFSDLGEKKGKNKSKSLHQKSKSSKRQRRKLKDEYTIKKQLGEGTYGKVHLATGIFTGKEVAVKSIIKQNIRKKERLQREIAIMKSINHPNIVKLYESLEDKNYLHISMEVCYGGELFDYISAKMSFSEKEAAFLAHQIIGAVAYLHEKGIAHRDLKPENFLFKERNNPKTLVLIDFGLSRYYSENTLMKTKVGTPYYIAPEVLACHYDNSCDIWSIGVIIYIFLCGYPPFWGETESEIFSKIKKGNLCFHPKEWENVSETAQNLIKSMLNLKPSERISAKAALSHKWFTSAQSSVLLQVEVIERLKNFTKQNKLKKKALNVIAKLMNEDDIKNLQQQFTRIDTDRSGEISLVELSHALKKVGDDPSNQELKILLNELDTDGNGTIEYNEFIAATIGEQLYLKDEILQKAFAHFDTEHTGKISSNTSEVRGESEDKINYEDFKRLMSTNETGITPN